MDVARLRALTHNPKIQFLFFRNVEMDVARLRALTHIVHKE